MRQRRTCILLAGAATAGSGYLVGTGARQHQARIFAAAIHDDQLRHIAPGLQGIQVLGQAFGLIEDRNHHTQGGCLQGEEFRLSGAAACCAAALFTIQRTTTATALPGGATVTVFAGGDQRVGNRGVGKQVVDVPPAITCK